MPRRIVTIQPPGSLPGMRNLAIAPTMRPNNSHPRMFMLFLQACAPLARHMDEQQKCRVPSAGAEWIPLYTRRSAVMAKVQRIGILTGGGDCPGLNAVIR